MPQSRATTHNVGLFVDRDMPDDRHIVAGLVVLMDDTGNFSAYMSQHPAGVGRPTAPMPSDEVLLEISHLLAQAWHLASLTTTATEQEN